jgi:hypothetical protein
MREDLLELLEKRFPDGFLIMYPTNGGKDTRLCFVAEKGTPACRNMQAAHRIIMDAQVYKHG